MASADQWFTNDRRQAALHSLQHVLMRDLGTLTRDQFERWTREMDRSFAPAGLTLECQLHNRSVLFTVKEVETGRAVFRFTSLTRVSFDDAAVTSCVEEFVPPQHAAVA